jgi:hypothetical protein
MRRPVSDGMLYAPKLSTRSKAQEMKETGNENERLGQQRAWALKKGSWQSDLGKIHLGRYEPKGSNQIPTLC